MLVRSTAVQRLAASIGRRSISSTAAASASSLTSSRTSSNNGNNGRFTSFNNDNHATTTFSLNDLNNSLSLQLQHQRRTLSTDAPPTAPPAQQITSFPSLVIGPNHKLEPQGSFAEAQAAFLEPPKDVVCRFWPDASGKTTLLLGANGARGPALVGLYSMDGTKLKEVNLDKQPIKSLALDVDGGRIVVGLMSGAKSVYSCPGLGCIKKTKELHSLPAQSVAFLGEATAVSGSGDRDLHLLSFKGGSGSVLCYLFVLLLGLMMVAAMVLRIGVKGASLGQGRLEM